MYTSLINLETEYKDSTSVDFLDRSHGATSEGSVIPLFKRIASITNLLDELEFDENIKSMVIDICDHIYSRDSNIEASISGDEEFLIFKRLGKDNWINLIIDEDGDAEIMYICQNRKKSFNEYHYFGEYDIEGIVKRFNELQ